MKKVVFKEVSRCDKCPYFHYQQNTVHKYGHNDWYECGYVDKIIILMKDFLKYKDIDPFEFPIPDWCPLENYDLFHKAIDIVKNNMDNE